jgi:hypothetical protein
VQWARRSRRRSSAPSAPGGDLGPATDQRATRAARPQACAGAAHRINHQCSRPVPAHNVLAGPRRGVWPVALHESAQVHQRPDALRGS